ncbi:hypothetical protein GCM10007052_28680 [Halioglobus japonicus]|nr:hypothetical protein GCM10007052_28680 [Halioglobus japonicus]
MPPSGKSRHYLQRLNRMFPRRLLLRQQNRCASLCSAIAVSPTAVDRVFISATSAKRWWMQATKWTLFPVLPIRTSIRGFA